MIRKHSRKEEIVNTTKEIEELARRIKLGLVPCVVCSDEFKFTDITVVYEEDGDMIGYMCPLCDSIMSMEGELIKLGKFDSIEDGEA